MGWSQTGRVALVWPTRGQLMDRRLDLVLLQRHSQSLGVQIALVTNDPEVRFQARIINIPVFRSVREAQTARWRRIRRISYNRNTAGSGQERLTKIQALHASPLHRNRDTHTLSQPVRIGIFALAVVAVLSIAAALIPSAEIYITPDTKMQEIDLAVQADDSVEAINLSGVLPAKWKDVSVEGRGSTQTTGSVSIPIGHVTGEVVFQNLTDQIVIIPAGTVVSTANSSHRFMTQRETRLPAGPGNENVTPIKAITPGSSSNLSTGRIIAIEGDLGVLVTVNNLSPTTGGSMAPSPAPNAADRSRLREDLISSLSQNALQEIQDTLSPGDILLSETPTLVQVISESYNPNDIQPASELELILRLEFKAPYVAVEDLDMLANSILDANLPVGYAATPDSMMVEQLSTPIFDNGVTSSWRIRLSRHLHSEPSAKQAISLALGRTPDQAGEILMKNLSITSAPRFETSPSWWPIIPLIPFRVDVISTGALQASNSAADEVLIGP